MQEPQQQMALIPVAAINYVLNFVKNHVGITHAQADPVVKMLESTGIEGIRLLAERDAQIVEFAERIKALETALDPLRSGSSNVSPIRPASDPK